MSEWVKNKPYVGEDGIYEPCTAYSESGKGTQYRLVIPKEIFIKLLKNSVSIEIFLLKKSM